MEDDLVAGGRVIRIETRGRTSGLSRSVAVGFVEDPDMGEAGALLVAARSDETAWARNLLADPRCRVALDTRRFEAIAEPLTHDEHVRAIRALIVRYGTPSEDLGRGPSFRLRPVREEP
ncbi:MAG TPA: nitroreductase family deazaflavin-dependent oxidoreductase [Candidatus Limnocylindrales bacterium]|nr:nitroreductase family deazaflavin-dependent oxidoreductase [Candidatus Limnocylindrales bacterium]